MSGERRHLDPEAEPMGGMPSRRPGHDSPGPALAGLDDPRLAHAGGAAGLLDLQRTAGNAAVSSMVAPSVQRAVTIDEVTTDVGTEGAGPAALTGESAPGETGEQTITGSVIRLAAPVTHADGILEADTVVANTIVAATYTPGAGNLM
jgi:hypothetical protein